MKIAFKLTTIFTLTTILSLAILSATSLFILRNEVLERTKVHLMEEAVERDRKIGQIIERYRQALESLSVKGTVKQALQTNSADSQELLREEFVEALEEEGLQHLIAYTNDYQEIVTVSAARDSHARHQFSEGYRTDYLIGRHAVEMWAEKDLQQGGLALYFRVRVDFEGVEVGHIIMVADIEPIYAVVRDYSGLGKTGETVLAQQLADGRLQYIFALRYDANSSMRILEDSPRLAIHEVVGNSGYYYTDAVDYRGESVLAAGRKIDLSNWVMVVKMDKEEAFKMLLVFQKSISVVTLVSLVVAMLGGLWLSSTFSSPIVAMSKVTKEIASGQFSRRVAVTAHDEVGELGNSFNVMAQKLEAVMRGLEEKVWEKTQELETTVKQLRQKAQWETNTKKAMINLLEDAQELQEELKKEKLGVEQKVVERTKELNEKTEALEEAREKATAGWMQLQVEKARLKASIEAMPLGLLILDTNHQVIGFNEASKMIIGQDKDEVISTENFQRFLASIKLELTEICPHCREGGIGYNGQELVTNDTYYRLISEPVILDGAVVGSIYLIENITNTKKLQRTRDEFFSVASHELRTPLTAIRGNTQMLLDYYPEIMNNGEVKDMVNDVHMASVRLIQIVNDFLDASRLELKKVDMKIEKIELKELLMSSMEEVKAVALEKKLEWKLVMHVDESVCVLGDKMRLQQVVINLLGNAIKFTEKGGVYVDVEALDNGYIRVKVSDTGAGILKVDQEDLFQKFKQVGSNAGLTRAASQGSGMGLYISKLIMENMGGSIHLEYSEIGKGSTFAFDLPQAPVA